MTDSVFQKSGVYLGAFGVEMSDYELCVACACTWNAHRFSTGKCPENIINPGPIMFREVLRMDDFGLYENLWYSYHKYAAVNKLRRVREF